MSKGKFTKWPLRLDCGSVRAIARMIASAPEMYALLGRLEDYFKNRHIYGYGVDESVSADLLEKIQEVLKMVDGNNQKDSL